MSFDPRFTSRFERVIQPAIARISVGGTDLTAHRVDRSTISDSIIAEIIEGITTDMLVLVDITTIAIQDERPIRNGNVMYELGLAHAIRQPEEVVIFRSDSDPLLFDVSGIRVHTYAPDEDPDAALQQVKHTVGEALRTTQLVDRWVIDRGIRALDPMSIALLIRLAGGPAAGEDFEDLGRLVRDPRFFGVIHRLFDLGLIHSVPQRATSPENPKPAGLLEMTRIRLTRAGAEVVQELFEQTGIFETFGAQDERIDSFRREWLAKRRRPLAG